MISFAVWIVLVLKDSCWTPHSSPLKDSLPMNCRAISANSWRRSLYLIWEVDVLERASLVFFLLQEFEWLQLRAPSQIGSTLCCTERLLLDWKSELLQGLWCWPLKVCGGTGRLLFPVALTLSWGKFLLMEQKLSPVPVAVIPLWFGPLYQAFRVY